MGASFKRGASITIGACFTTGSSFTTGGSLVRSCFNVPLTGCDTGELGGLTRTTLNLTSSMYLPFSFENYQGEEG